MNAPTDRTGSIDTAPSPGTTTLGTTTQLAPPDAAQPVPEPRTRGFAAPAPAAPQPAASAARTVRLWVAAVIATAAFLVGLGASMLLGPLGGPPAGGPGGTGGPGGDPGTSQTQQDATGTGQGTGA